ncbi:MAG: SRPBCC domain-containing protein [Actinomycetota bacterium]
MPLRMFFQVHCSAERAFDVWTSEVSLWWPIGRTRLGEPVPDIVLEPRIGGRIYERTSGGAEIDCGEVIKWEPPRRLVYLWRIQGERRRATEVAVTFRERGDSTTRVRIEHRGWQQLCSKRGWEAADEEARRRFSAAASTPSWERASGCAGPYFYVAEPERRLLVEEPLLDLFYARPDSFSHYR